ncbi:hypothetical protein AA11825_2619 [Acetobacter pomorum DSM 11825]|nr:hypothetical protein AA11825_2619 [Acetobacter pomorum DSM 11825]
MQVTKLSAQWTSIVSTDEYVIRGVTELEDYFHKNNMSKGCAKNLRYFYKRVGRGSNIPYQYKNCTIIDLYCHIIHFT